MAFGTARYALTSFGTARYALTSCGSQVGKTDIPGAARGAATAHQLCQENTFGTVLGAALKVCAFYQANATTFSQTRAHCAWPTDLQFCGI